MICETCDKSVYAIMSEDLDIYGPMRIFNIADPNDITQDQVEMEVMSLNILRSWMQYSLMLSFCLQFIKQ